MKVFSEDIRRKFTGEINLILEMFHLDNTGLVLFRDKKPLIVDKFNVHGDFITFDLVDYPLPLTFRLTDVIQIGFRSHTIHCDKCESKRIEQLGGVRYQCYDCGHKWEEKA